MRAIFQLAKVVGFRICFILPLIAGCGPQNSSPFVKYVLTTDFISEGVAVGDVDHDGKLDILAGAYWFKSPDWERYEIVPGKTFNADSEYSHSFLNFSSDINKDGWIDLVVVDFPGTAATWFENPQRGNEPWKRHLIYQTVANESPAFVDMDGDGQGDLVCADPKDGQMIWLKAPTPVSEAWTKFTISEKKAPGTGIFSHGLGVGDINGDHRPDVIVREGWWEGPTDPRQPGWKFHVADLGQECSQMYVTDVNGDGLADVVSASAHLSGIWWHEQRKDSSGISWEHHVISYAFAESHAVAMTDLNGDGYADIVTGKRNLKRNTWRKNPGTHGPPLLYWFEFTPGKEPYWIPHSIDSASGAGLNLVARDINQDGSNDLVISNFKGVFVFENHLKKDPDPAKMSSKILH